MQYLSADSGMVEAAAAESTGWELQGGCGAEAEESRASGSRSTPNLAHYESSTSTIDRQQKVVLHQIPTPTRSEPLLFPPNHPLSKTQ